MRLTFQCSVKFRFWIDGMIPFNGGQIIVTVCQTNWHDNCYDKYPQHFFFSVTLIRCQFKIVTKNGEKEKNKLLWNDKIQQMRWIVRVIVNRRRLKLDWWNDVVAINCISIEFCKMCVHTFSCLSVGNQYTSAMKMCDMIMFNIYR